MTSPTRRAVASIWFGGWAAAWVGLLELMWSGRYVGDRLPFLGDRTAFVVCIAALAALLGTKFFEDSAEPTQVILAGTAIGLLAAIPDFVVQFVRVTMRAPRATVDADWVVFFLIGNLVPAVVLGAFAGWGLQSLGRRLESRSTKPDRNVP